jgi:acetyl-CoA carboxylase biotin carboxyl carrier protein
VRVRENAAVGLSRQELVSLTDAFEDIGLDELILDIGGTRVELTSSGKPPLGAMGALAPARTLLHEVVAPSVGIVRLGPAPDAPPFAAAGSGVGSDDVVCLLEVWTSTMPVKAGIDGTVREVHVDEGAMAEYGQVLLSVEPAEPHRAADTSSERPAAARSSSRSA